MDQVRFQVFKLLYEGFGPWAVVLLRMVVFEGDGEKVVNNKNITESASIANI